MKTELELNEMILGVTNNIREKHPELLKYPNEMPITIPYEENLGTFTNKRNCKNGIR